jgi:hypothetical protein
VTLATVAWDPDEEALAGLVDRLLATTGIEPARLLVISNADAVNVFAARGCRFEYLPPRGDFERQFPGQDYQPFLARRLIGVMGSFAIDRLLMIGEPADDMLRALVSAEALGSLTR